MHSLISCCRKGVIHVHLPPTPLHRYFLLCVNYFFYGETVTDYFFSLVQREEPLRILSKYHRFISFALYLTGTNAEAQTFRSTLFTLLSDLVTWSVGHKKGSQGDPVVGECLPGTIIIHVGKCKTCLVKPTSVSKKN